MKKPGWGGRGKAQPFCRGNLHRDRDTAHHGTHHTSNHMNSNNYIDTTPVGAFIA